MQTFQSGRAAPAGFCTSARNAIRIEVSFGAGRNHPTRCPRPIHPWFPLRPARPFRQYQAPAVRRRRPRLGRDCTGTSAPTRPKTRLVWLRRWPAIAGCRPGEEAPGRAPDAARHKPQGRAPHVQRQMPDAPGDHPRFIPSVVMREFEGLLFADPKKSAESTGHPRIASAFRAIRGAWRHRKPAHGSRAAPAIGLATMNRARLTVSPPARDDRPRPRRSAAPRSSPPAGCTPRERPPA